MKSTVKRALLIVRKMIWRINSHIVGLTEQETKIVFDAETTMHRMGCYASVKKLSQQTLGHIMFQCQSYQDMLFPILERQLNWDSNCTMEVNIDDDEFLFEFHDNDYTVELDETADDVMDSDKEEDDNSVATYQQTAQPFLKPTIVQHVQMVTDMLISEQLVFVNQCDYTQYNNILMSFDDNDFYGDERIVTRNLLFLKDILSGKISLNAYE